jgi:Ribbon-helix-helix protein, copG family
MKPSASSADRQRQKRTLEQPREEVSGRDRVRGRQHVGPGGHVREGGRGGQTLFASPTGGITIQSLWYYRYMRAISLKLPDDIDTRLEARARELGRTKSQITREALVRFLEGEPMQGVSCLDLVRDLVGVARGPGDLASNKKHLRGYGR